MPFVRWSMDASGTKRMSSEPAGVNPDCALRSGQARAYPRTELHVFIDRIDKINHEQETLSILLIPSKSTMLISVSVGNGISS